MSTILRFFSDWPTVWGGRKIWANRELYSFWQNTPMQEDLRLIDTCLIAISFLPDDWGTYDTLSSSVRSFQFFTFHGQFEVHRILIIDKNIGDCRYFYIFFFARGCAFYYDIARKSFNIAKMESRVVTVVFIAFVAGFQSNVVRSRALGKYCFYSTKKFHIPIIFFAIFSKFRS